MSEFIWSLRHSENQKIHRISLRSFKTREECTRACIEEMNHSSKYKDHSKWLLCIDCRPGAYAVGYSTYELRLASFSPRWPSALPAKPADLAKAGFYFSQYGDSVVCFLCGLELSQWQVNDNPDSEHRRHVGNQGCMFLDAREQNHASTINKSSVNEEHAMVNSKNISRAVVSSDGYKLQIDGLTIIKSLWVGFSMPPSYMYDVKETGDKFYSNSNDIMEAYLAEKQWRVSKD